MAETFDNTLSDIGQVFRDCPPATATRLINQTLKSLAEEFRLSTSEQSITLDGTSREFPFEEDWVAIWSAEYLSSATGRYPLDETSVDELDTEEAGWRRAISGTPSRYYLWQDENGAQVIGFDIIPGTATSGSYPIVKVQVSQHTDLEAGDSLPATLKNNFPVVAGACYQWAMRKHQDQAQSMAVWFENEKNQLGVYRQRRQRRNDPRTLPFFTSGAARR